MKCLFVKVNQFYLSPQIVMKITGHHKCSNNWYLFSNKLNISRLHYVIRKYMLLIGIIFLLIWVSQVLLFFLITITHQWGSGPQFCSRKPSFKNKLVGWNINGLCKSESVAKIRKYKLIAKVRIGHWITKQLFQVSRSCWTAKSPIK